MQKIWVQRVLVKNFSKRWLTVHWRVTCQGVWLGVGVRTYPEDGFPMGRIMTCMPFTVRISYLLESMLLHLALFTGFFMKAVGRRNWNSALPVPIRNVQHAPSCDRRSNTRRAFRSTQRHVTSSFDTWLDSSQTEQYTISVAVAPRPMVTCCALSQIQWISLNILFLDIIVVDRQRMWPILPDLHLR